MRNLIRLAAFAVVLALSVPSHLVADSAARLTDLAPGDDDGLQGLDAAVLDGALYFVGESASGNAIYRYDGVTPPAPVAGSAVLAPNELIAWNGKLYFQGGPSGDKELWSYDPEGPALGEAIDVRSNGNALPQHLAIAGDELCFGAFTDTQGFELVCWNGISPHQVFDVALGPDSSFPDDLAAWDGGLAFTAQLDGEDTLVVYDGASPPAPVAAGPSEPFSGPTDYTGFAGNLFFQALDGGSSARVFRYDGVSPPARDSTTLSPNGTLGQYRGTLVTDGIDPAIGLSTSELLRRGGAGFRRVSPGVEINGSMGHSTAAGGLYFVAYPEPSSNDADLYRYCGAGAVAPATAAFAGTAMTVTSERLVVFGGRVFVAASDPDFGEELWAVTPQHIFCDDFEAGTLVAWP